MRWLIRRLRGILEAWMNSSNRCVNFRSHSKDLRVMPRAKRGMMRRGRNRSSKRPISSPINSPNLKTRKSLQSLRTTMTGKDTVTQELDENPEDRCPEVRRWPDSRLGRPTEFEKPPPLRFGSRREMSTGTLHRMQMQYFLHLEIPTIDPGSRILLDRPSSSEECTNLRPSVVSNYYRILCLTSTNTLTQ